MLTITDLHNEQELSSFQMRNVVGGSIDTFLKLGTVKSESCDPVSRYVSPLNTSNINGNVSAGWDLTANKVI
jgi:hypothetical protein